MSAPRTRAAQHITAIVCGALAIAAGRSALAQASPAASAGIYSKVQAARGAQLYSTHCAACHGGTLEGIDVAPPLAGSSFLSNWNGQSVGALATRIRSTMPLDEPDTLSAATTADIVAHMLEANGYPAGDIDLPRDAQQLQQAMIDAPPPR